jgi:hypothetical protein
MVGVNGSKFPAIRAHLEQNIAQVYKDLDISYVATHLEVRQVVETFLSVSMVSQETTRRTQKPVRQSCLAEALNHSYPYLPIDKVAIDKFNPGDAVVIFTPDSKCPAHAQKLAVCGALFFRFFFKIRTTPLLVMRLNADCMSLLRSQPRNSFRTT